MEILNVSVVIPTYGRAEGLARALESALSQNFEDFEVIVVDDNDPDTPARTKTSATMQEFLKKPKVKYIQHEKNKNGAAARNTGIFAAKGKYVAFLDDDDIFLPGHLQKLFEYLENTPQHAAAYTWRIQNNVEDRPTCEGDLTRLLLTGHYCAPTSTMMMERKVLTELGGFNEIYRRHQDVEIMVRYFEKGYTLGVVKEVLTYMDNSDDLNRPHGQALEDMKEMFLSDFAPVIERLDKEKSGTKRKIICENQVRVWADYFHRGPASKAWKIYKKFASVYPFYFTYVCVKFTLNAIYLKTCKKLSKLKGCD